MPESSFGPVLWCVPHLSPRTPRVALPRLRQSPALRLRAFPIRLRTQISSFAFVLFSLLFILFGAGGHSESSSDGIRGPGRAGGAARAISPKCGEGEVGREMEVSVWTFLVSVEDFPAKEDDEGFVREEAHCCSVMGGDMCEKRVLLLARLFYCIAAADASALPEVYIVLNAICRLLFIVI
ncbi:hypothetical protein HPP92_026877 [Vanilla planifolia]|uniref:Uncharacterized protein n=1 Tax=Vanilla planifolia TaxID=51239 RepID=A0A835PH41_VANPL|nr:hypothetical protein HPP92_026877 [Vanilla planifolia]KAG0484898.1 hypothetical protein HPP92_008977 [Vanilla planifolia]